MSVERFLRPKALAEVLGVSKSKLYEMVKAGELPRPCVLSRDRNGFPRIVGWWEGDLHEFRERTRREVV